MSTTRTPAQPLFVACHGTPFLDQDEKEQASIHVKSPPISDDEENHSMRTDVESNYDDLRSEKSLDIGENDASMSDNNDDMYLNETSYRSLPVDINNVLSPSMINDGSLPNKINNDARIDSPVNAVKMVLVPVRDPLTREIRNALIPVEVKDETGLNIIKSVLIPVQDEDGLMSYEIKKVVVPIKPELSLPQKKSKPLPSKGGNSKPINGGRKTEDKKSEEKEVEKEKDVKESVEEDKKEESKKEDLADEQSTVDIVKEEVDRMLEDVKNICPYCQKTFEDEIQVDRHVRKNHKKPFRCSICYNSYVSKESLDEHVKIHGKDTQLECPFCHQKYKRMVGLRYHQIRAHSTIEPKFECDQCGKRFKLKQDLASHIERTHVMEIHICRFCGKSVRNIKQHEWQHEKAENKVEFPFSCHLCPAKFRRQTGLDNHLLVHKNSIKCDQCSKAFMSNCELEDHKANRSGPKSYLCRYCHNAYSQKSCLVAHKLLVHGIQHRVPKEFPCNICSKSFATEDSLRKHITLHSKMFACSYCGREFSNSHNLKLHIRKHTGERPYECKVCKKCFARSNALRIHRLTHTGERPYVCDLCGQSFTQRSSMMAHRRKHPGSHPPPPPLLLSKLECNENEF